MKKFFAIVMLLTYGITSIGQVVAKHNCNDKSSFISSNDCAKICKEKCTTNRLPCNVLQVQDEPVAEQTSYYIDSFGLFAIQDPSYGRLFLTSSLDLLFPFKQLHDRSQLVNIRLHLYNRVLLI